MKLLLIEQDRVQVTWPLVKDLLQKPLDLNLGEFNSEDILNWLLGGQMQLWVLVSEDFSGIMVAAVTEFVTYPREKRLRMVLVSSEPNTFDKWFEYCWRDGSELLQYAKANEVKRIESTGRDGWTRVLSSVGFSKYYTVLTKDVN
tara:strand:- start:165 stop:599 length:435 start_codon:yes stop_codon:yes gene_type:complete